jgi:hypothetical protein
VRDRLANLVDRQVSDVSLEETSLGKIVSETVRRVMILVYTSHDLQARLRKPNTRPSTTREEVNN